MTSGLVFFLMYGWRNAPKLTENTLLVERLEEMFLEYC